MEVKSNDADSVKNLDVEFRRILRIIKPYIPCVMNNDYLTFYRLWLEKLNDTESSEKQERNRYLIELCYQIQDGILEYPFTQLPVAGPLAHFSNKFLSSNVQIQEQYLRNSADGKLPKIQENSIQETLNCINTSGRLSSAMQQGNVSFENSPRAIDGKLEPNDETAEDSEPSKATPRQLESRKPHKRRNHHTLLNNLRAPPVQNQNVYGDYAFKPPCYSVDSPKSQFQHTDIFKLDSIKPFVQQYAVNTNYMHMLEEMPTQVTPRRVSRQQLINLNISTNKEGEDSSWLDLSETSNNTTEATKLESGDSDTLPTARTDNNMVDKTYEMYENKIVDLMKTITTLQKQNVTLNEDVAKYERDLTLRNSKAETSIHNLACEVNSLKTRLQELTDIKATLKNNQLVASSQWENTINSMGKELQKAQTNNAELKADIAVLQKRQEDYSSQRLKDNAALRQKLAELHNKEIDMLKQNHARHVTDTENKSTQKLSELKEQCEHKICQLNNEYKRIIGEKNSEIQRLELMINTQCKKMHDEVIQMRTQMEGNSSANANEENFNKVLLLQKCVARMDRLFKKSEKHFNKQIAKLKHEIELRDKIIQIQLSAQRAELISNTNLDRQIEVDATVVQLEERYKKLLEAQQTHFLADKRQDCKLISELRAVIAKNNMDN